MKIKKLTNEERDKVQKDELKILIEFDKICKKNNFFY